MSKLRSILFTKRPLVVNVDLWIAIGLQESIIVQQIFYWIERNREKKRNLHEGHFWTYNTYEGWQEQFPGWHINTIRRLMKKLEDRGIIITGNFNSHWSDRTKWYRLDEDVLEGSLSDATSLVISGIEQPQDLHTCQPQDIADEETSMFPEQNRENWERLQAIGHVKGLRGKKRVFANNKS